VEVDLHQRELRHRDLRIPDLLTYLFGKLSGLKADHATVLDQIDHLRASSVENPDRFGSAPVGMSTAGT
jgi:hypothetical protein